MLLKAENVLGMAFSQKKIGKKYDVYSVDEAMEYFAEQLDLIYAGKQDNLSETKLEEYILVEDGFLKPGYDKNEVDEFLYRLMLTVKALKKQNSK